MFNDMTCFQCETICLNIATTCVLQSWDLAVRRWFGMNVELGATLERRERHSPRVGSDTTRSAMEHPWPLL
jgi:hypothetical protein